MLHINILFKFKQFPFILVFIFRVGWRLFRIPIMVVWLGLKLNIKLYETCENCLHNAFNLHIYFSLLIPRRHVSVICFYKSAHVTLKMKIRIKRERNKLVLGKCPWKRWKWLKFILTVCVGYFQLYHKQINFTHQPPYIYFFCIYRIRHYTHRYNLIKKL